MAKEKTKTRSGFINPTETRAPQKVKMKFTEDKFYNDLEKPCFVAGQVYELEGADWIQRWIKRGGTIVDGDEALAEKPAAESSEGLAEETKAAEEEAPASEEETEEVVDEHEKKEKKHRFGHKR